MKRAILALLAGGLVFGVVFGVGGSHFTLKTTWEPRGETEVH